MSISAIVTGMTVDRAAQTVTLTFSEQLDATVANLPGTGRFSVTTQINGAPTANQVLSVAVSGNTVTLTLAAPFQAGQVDVSYTDLSAANDVSGVIQDLLGNDALGFASGRAAAGAVMGGATG